MAGAEQGSVKCRAQKGSGLGSEARGCTTLKGAYYRGATMVVVAVQGLGSARQRNMQWAQAAAQAQGSGHWTGEAHD